MSYFDETLTNQNMPYFVQEKDSEVKKEKEEKDSDNE